jgi:N-methylhydantoinase B
MRGADHVSFHLGKVSSYPMTAGDVLTMRAAGGGGYGDPLERDVSLVVDDVADEYITPERAYEAYGVVLDAKGVPDLEETTSRRTELD